MAPFHTTRIWQVAATAVCVLMLAAPLADAQPAPSQPQAPATSAVGETAWRFQAGLAGVLGIPVGEFEDSVGLTGGLAGDFSYRLGDSPVRVGADVAVVWYGHETRRLPFSLTIPDVLVDVTTSSAIVMTHARIRIQPVRGSVRPYVDGLVGFNYVFTDTSIDLDEDPFFPEAHVRTTNFSDFAFSAGGGAGVMTELTSSDDNRLSLDVGVRYVHGGRVDYLVLDRLDFGDRVSDLDIHRSRTDLLVFKVGVAFEF